MGDEHGVSAVSTFRAALYVLITLYLALVLVPFADPLYALSMVHVAKSLSAYVLLILEIKLTQKLRNNLIELNLELERLAKSNPKLPIPEVRILGWEGAGT
jgi:hypothetical protein